MKFMTKKEFGENVEIVVRDKQLSYMEAILYLCEEEGIDPEDARKFITPVIKGKLEYEAEQLNYLPRKNRLNLE